MIYEEALVELLRDQRGRVKVLCNPEDLAAFAKEMGLQELQVVGALKERAMVYSMYDAEAYMVATPGIEPDHVVLCVAVRLLAGGQVVRID